MMDKLLTPADVSEMLAVTSGALAQLRYLGTGPKYVKLTGRSVRYRERDVEEWVEAHLRSTTDPGSRRDS